MNRMAQAVTYNKHFLALTFAAFGLGPENNINVKCYAAYRAFVDYCCETFYWDADCVRNVLLNWHNQFGS